MRVMFLFFSVLVSAIVASVLLLSVSALPAPLPQMGGSYQGHHHAMRFGPDQQLARLNKEPGGSVVVEAGRQKAERRR
jgi:hypothetical protein